jgi:molybdenum cofactor cytidylyltransferase
MGVQKVLLPLDGRPLVCRAVDAAVASAARPTVVVVGHEAARVRFAVAGRPVTVVTNDRYAEGMSTSLQAGIAALEDGVPAALFLLGDQPFVTAALLDRLIERYVATRAPVVRPEVDGRPSTPVLMSAELFPEIEAQRGDVGGRLVVERHAGQVSLVSTTDTRLAVDVDCAGDYEAAKGIA